MKESARSPYAYRLEEPLHPIVNRRRAVDSLIVLTRKVEQYCATVVPREHHFDPFGFNKSLVKLGRNIEVITLGYYQVFLLKFTFTPVHSRALIGISHFAALSR